MNLLPTLRDSRGKQSTTLFLIATSWLAMTVVFVWTAFTNKDASNIATYGGAVTALLVPWLGREFIRSKEGQ